MVFEKAIFIFHVTFFNVTWKMKLLLQYYTFRKKISNNIFFGPILMELHFLFMNVEYRVLSVLLTHMDCVAVCRAFIFAVA